MQEKMAGRHPAATPGSQWSAGSVDQSEPGGGEGVSAGDDGGTDRDVCSGQGGHRLDERSHTAGTESLPEVPALEAHIDDRTGGRTDENKISDHDRPGERFDPP